MCIKFTIWTDILNWKLKRSAFTIIPLLTLVVILSLGVLLLHRASKESSSISNLFDSIRTCIFFLAPTYVIFFLGRTKLDFVNPRTNKLIFMICYETAQAVFVHLEKRTYKLKSLTGIRSNIFGNFKQTEIAIRMLWFIIRWLDMYDK